jgi:hypothetical protein
MEEWTRFITDRMEQLVVEAKFKIDDVVCFCNKSVRYKVVGYSLQLSTYEKNQEGVYVYSSFRIGKLEPPYIGSVVGDPWFAIPVTEFIRGGPCYTRDPVLLCRLSDGSVCAEHEIYLDKPEIEKIQEVFTKGKISLTESGTYIIWDRNASLGQLEALKRVGLNVLIVACLGGLGIRVLR